MTTIYFIRHAQSDTAVRDGRIRPLTPKGAADANRLPARFAAVDVHQIYSSPFKRAVDTVLPIAKAKGLPVLPVEDFRERRSDSQQIIPRDDLIRRQWADFSYTLSDGECFGQVQKRNLSALQKVLAHQEGKTVLIGTHGVAMSCILHHYVPLTIEEVGAILLQLPYGVCLRFDGQSFVDCQKVDLLP